MFLANLDGRTASAIRLVGLGLITWTVLTSAHHPGTAGRHLVVAIVLAALVLAWLAWMRSASSADGVTPDLYLLAAGGGVLLGAAPDSAASAFIFVAVVAAGLRTELERAVPVLVVGAISLGIFVLLYSDSALGLLAYVLGFCAALLAASNSHQSVLRADQAELLLAQAQRSHEEQLRGARLEESARIAREIHDVLAHTLAGLVIQLEATGSLIEQGADEAIVLERVRGAHELARGGLDETRRAVGALRGSPASAPRPLQALLAEHRAIAGSPVELSVEVELGVLSPVAAEAVQRVAQEALTNVRKHAPGSAVSVSLSAAEGQLRLIVEDRPGAPGQAHDAHGLAASGGGFGLIGMRERAEQLGGTLSAGPVAAGGWRVELHLPLSGDAAMVAHR